MIESIETKEDNNNETNFNERHSNSDDSREERMKYGKK